MKPFNKKQFYLIGILFILIVSFFIVRKIKKNYIPLIELSSLVLKDLNGKDIALTSFAGKPLVINFGGTWCGPCRQEFPDFEKVKQKYASQVNFIMVSDEKEDKIEKFRIENNFTFLFAQSPITFDKLGITSVPVTYLYDAKGNLYTKKKETLSEQQLDELIAELNNKK